MGSGRHREGAVTSKDHTTSWRHKLFDGVIKLKDDQATNSWLYAVLVSYRNLQLVHLSLSEELGGPWNAAIHPLRKGLRALCIGFIDLTDFGLFIMGLICIVWTGVLLIMVVAMSFQPSSFGVTSTRVIELSLRSSQIPFQQSLVMLLTRSFWAANDITELTLMARGGTIICILIIVILTSSTALVVLQHLPGQSESSPRGLSMVHGRIECLTTGICAFFAVLAGVVVETSHRATDASEGPSVALLAFARWSLAVGLACISALYFFFAPFYSLWLNRLCLYLFSSSTFVALCNLGVVFVNDAEDLSWLLVCILTMPFLLVSVRFAHEMYLRRLTHSKGPFEMRHPLIAELILRLRHLRGEPKEWSFSGDLERDYRAAVAGIPDNPYFGLYVALLAGSLGNSIVFALKLIRQARRSIRSFDEYVLLAYNNKVNERRQEKHTGAVTYLQHDNHLTAARLSIVQITRHVSQFWKKTSQGQYSMSELLELANKVHGEVVGCQAHLANLTRLARNDAQGLRVRAMFLHYIENDTERASDMMARAASFDDDAGIGGFAVCVISGDLATLCKVLDASQPMCTLFGYSKLELIGRNINMIIPPPFDHIHDLMVRSFVNSDSDFRTRTRRIYGLHRKGHIMPIDFVLTPSTNAKSDLVLVARLEPKPLDVDEYLLLVDRKTRVVTGYSEGAPSALHFDGHDVFAMAVNVTRILPNLFDSEGNIAYESNELVECVEELWKIRVQALEYSSRPEDSSPFSCSVLLIRLKLATRGGMMQSAFILSGAQLGSAPRSASKAGSRFGGRSSSKSLRQVSRMHLGGLALSNQMSRGQSHHSRGPQSPSRSPTSPRGLSRSVSKASSPFQMAGARIARGHSAASKSASMANAGFSAGLHGGAASMSSAGDEASSVSGSVKSGVSSIGADKNGMARIKRLIKSKLGARDAQVMRFQWFSTHFGITLFAAVAAHVVLMISRAWVQATFVRSIQTLGLLVHSSTLASVLLLYANAGVSRDMVLAELTVLVPEMHSRYTNFSTNTMSSVDGLGAMVLERSVNISAYETDGFELVSFDSAMRDMLSHLSRIVDAGDATTCGPSCRFVINNGAHEVLQHGRGLLDAVQLSALAHFDVIREIERYCTVAIAVVLVVGIIVGYVPVLKSFNTKRWRMTIAFRSIPQSLSVKMHKNSEKSYQSLHQLQHAHEIATYNDDGDSDDDDEEGSNASDSAEHFPNERSTSGVGRHGPGAFSSLARPGGTTAGSSSMLRSPTLRASLRNVSMRKMTMRVGEVAALQKVRLSKKISRATRRTAKLCGAIFYVGISAWMTLAFVLVSFTLRTSLWAEMAHLSSSTYVAAVRAIDSAEVNFFGMVPLPSAVSDWKGAAWVFEDAQRRLEPAATTLATSNRALKFGSSELRLDPFMLTSGDEFDLNFGSGCLGRCLARYESAGAGSASSDGELTRRLRNGLVLAIDFYVRECYILGQMRSGLTPSVGEDEQRTQQEAIFGDLLANLMLSDALLQSVDNYAASLELEVAAHRLTEAEALLGLLALLLVGHVICKRAVAALEHELNKIFYLLSILPEDVFLRVPQFLLLLQD